jgi:hypothetical protein
MSAPLPIRFYNPLKELCKKVNLDYETVVGTGLSKTMRNAYINAEVEKPIDHMKSEDKKMLKHKKEFFDRKYGTVPTAEITGGEVEDKGRSRYDMGLIVEHIRPDHCEVDESQPPSNSLATITTTVCSGEFGDHLSGRRATGHEWVPGRSTANSRR